MFRLTKLVTLQKISLKNHPDIKEDVIQNYIYNNPSILGLGNLVPIMREKVQPAGGRLDLLLGTEDNESRYEVEIQLGATDPSHIIRTIEYWDVERKRYPQYDHCAVIVAEEITSRFMNVISLFNGNIPLIALQLSAHQVGENISLSFTKVLDRLSLGTDEEEAEEVTDRAYWEDSQSTKSMMKNVDAIFSELNAYTSGFEMKYNKYYIGLAKDGITRNFISFKAKKKFLYICFSIDPIPEFDEKLENSSLESNYNSRRKQYNIRINNLSDFHNNKALIEEFVKKSKEKFNL